MSPCPSWCEVETNWYHGYHHSSPERTDEIRRLFAAGHSCSDIGCHFDLSRERISAIVKPSRPKAQPSSQRRDWAGFPRQVRPLFDWNPDYVTAVLDTIQDQ